MDKWVTFFTVVGAVVFGLVVYVAASFLFAIPTMLLWNWLMPSIFGLSSISYMQAWGLMCLSGLLLKNSNYSSKE